MGAASSEGMPSKLPPGMRRLSQDADQLVDTPSPKVEPVIFNPFEEGNWSITHWCFIYIVIIQCKSVKVAQTSLTKEHSSNKYNIKVWK